MFAFSHIFANSLTVSFSDVKYGMWAINMHWVSVQDKIIPVLCLYYITKHIFKNFKYS